jgi:predicted ATP-dependent endonuclease of OLD family
LLVLAMGVIIGKGTLLLVDEIDTGLHYSTMGEVWRVLADAAKRHDVQVFATTHSWDCVRGLAWLCENHPELRGEVSLQKIEPQLEEAVALDADEIMLAVSQGMEVR